jgi:hypothetical protein
MPLSPQEQELIALFRRIQNNRHLQIRLVELMYSWLDVDQDIRRELGRVRRDKGFESIEQPPPLILGSGASEGLDGFQFNRREVRLRSRNRVRVVRKPQQIIRRHPKNLGKSR